MLAEVLLVEWHGVSMVGDEVLGKVVYRFATEEHRDNFGKEAAKIMAERRNL